MFTRISEALGVTREDFARAGAFDGFLACDSKVYVSPKLLEKAQTPELQGARADILAHFRKVVRLLVQVQQPRDMFWKAAWDLLKFKEIPHLAMGYSDSGTAGRGIGKGLAEKILCTGLKIVQAGITDPEIFELVGVFQEQVGADRIGDMTLRLIFPRLLQYSQRLASELGLQTRQMKSGLLLPVTITAPSRPLVLVPREVLTKLPIAVTRDDIADVCHHNETLRRRLNRPIGRSWRRELARFSKRRLQEFVLSHPKEIIPSLLNDHKNKIPIAYDFDADPSGLFDPSNSAVRLAAHHPLPIALSDPSTLPAFVRGVCHHFKRLLEANGLCTVLYDNGKLRNEKTAQRIFHAVSTVWCRTFNVAISPESDSGRGPVDFTFSLSNDSKVCVEFKYSNNKKLEKGLSMQLPTYMAAESAVHGFYFILQVPGSDCLLANVQAQANQLPSSVEIVVADARPKPSASKL